MYLTTKDGKVTMDAVNSLNHNQRLDKYKLQF
jgi:hypothetical protein